MDNEKEIKDEKKDDINETPSEIEVLQKNLDEVKKEKDEYYDKFLRLTAEFTNYKNRVEREKKELIEYAHKEVAYSLLPILDSFEKALASSHDDKEKFMSGIKLVSSLLNDVLKKQGVSRMEVIDKDFDPNFHEAIGFDENDEIDENKITAEVHPGYLLHKKVLRPAMVRISKHKNNNDGGQKNG